MTRPSSESSSSAAGLDALDWHFYLGAFLAALGGGALAVVLTGLPLAGLGVGLTILGACALWWVRLALGGQAEAEQEFRAEARGREG